MGWWKCACLSRGDIRYAKPACHSEWTCQCADIPESSTQSSCASIYPAARVLLQQDNASSHTARATQQYLQALNINTIAWPSLSPDLAPIEHEWDKLGHRVYQHKLAPRNENELRQALLQEWQLIPQRRITNIINTMRQRCNACIAAGAGYTRF